MVFALLPDTTADRLNFRQKRGLEATGHLAGQLGDFQLPPGS
jgi:hypothetical protein